LTKFIRMSQGANCDAYETAKFALDVER